MTYEQEKHKLRTLSAAVLTETDRLEASLKAPVLGAKEVSAILADLEAIITKASAAANHAQGFEKALILVERQIAVKRATTGAVKGIPANSIIQKAQA